MIRRLAFLAVLLCTARGAWGLWEIQMSEIAVVFSGCFIVGACGFFWSLKSPKSIAFVTDLNISRPFISGAIKGYAFESGTVTPSVSVALVLRTCALPNILATIVQRIVVLVVNHFAHSRVEYLPMHENKNFFPPNGVEVFSDFLRTPVKARERSEVLRINNSIQSLRQGNQSVRLVERLRHSVSQYTWHFAPLMRICGAAILLLFSLSPRAFSQTTVVSGTITDSGGQSWKQGTYSFSFKVAPTNPTGPYFFNGSPFSYTQTIQGALDTSAHFSVSIPSNTSINPAGSTWVLTVCPIAQGNTQCFTTQGLTITGATQDITGLVVPPRIQIDLAHPAYPFVMAYTNSEFSSAPIAGIYFDYTQQHYFLCTNVTPTGQAQWYGSCLTWKEFCLVGDGLCAAATTSWFLNNVLVGVEPNYDVIPGTNISISATDDPSHTRVHYTINATAAAGCTLPGIDTAVLSEHPASTCYDSLHWTWDDGTSKQNMQAGLSNTITNQQLAHLWGNSLTATSDLAGQMKNTLMLGDLASITMTGGSKSTIIDANFIGGGSVGAQTITATNGGAIFQVFCLIRACENSGAFHGIQATGAGGTTDTNINLIFSVGRFNDITAASLSNTSSIFTMSESSHFTSANGCNNSDNFTLGEVDTISCSGVSTADVDDSVVLGQNHSITSTTQPLSFVYTLGHANTVNQSSGAGIANIGLIGKSLTATNCSDYWVLGENVSNCTNSTVAIGFSATPEVTVQAGKVGVGAWPVTQLQTISICASGCTVTATPCTISSGASYDVCTNSITWPNAFVDSNYTVICNGEVNSTHASPGNGSTNYALTAFAQKGSLTTTTFTVVTQNQRTNTAAFDEIDCTGTHR